MRLLRDKAGLTRLLLLLELHRHEHTTLGALAAKLGVTPQAVSQHIAAMRRAGLVRASRGRYVVTPRGIALLQGRVGELKAFADGAFQRVHGLEECSAQAGARVRGGQPVGLFMEAGKLVARPGARSPSHGIAANDARAGELLVVRGLEGLVALAPGRVALVTVPRAAGGATRLAAASLRRLAAREAPDRVAALGTEARVLAEAARLGPDFAFAPVHASHHAAQLGLRVLLLTSPGESRFAMAELERLNEDALDPVRYDVRELRGPR